MEFPDWVKVKEKTLQTALKSVPRNHLSDAHKYGQGFTYYRNNCLFVHIQQ